MKLRLEIELQIEDDIYGVEPDEVAWLKSQLLEPEDLLILHSNYIGDEVGIVKVLAIHE